MQVVAKILLVLFGHGQSMRLHHRSSNNATVGAVPYCFVVDEPTCIKMTGQHSCVFPTPSKEKCLEDDSMPNDHLYECHKWGTCRCTPAVPKTGECSAAPRGLPPRDIEINGKSYCCDIDVKKVIPEQAQPYCLQVPDPNFCKGVTGQGECVFPTTSQAACEGESEVSNKWPLLAGCHTWGGCSCKPATAKVSNWLGRQSPCSRAPDGLPRREVWAKGQSWCCEPENAGWSPFGGWSPSPSGEEKPAPVPQCLVLTKAECQYLVGKDDCQVPQYSEEQCMDASNGSPKAECLRKGACSCKPAVKKDKTINCSKVPEEFHGAIAWPLGEEHCCEAQSQEGGFWDALR